MRTFDFKPDWLELNGFEGSIKLKVPHAKEKAGFLKALKFKFDPKTGEVSASEEITDTLVGMIELAEQMVLEVNLIKGEKIFTKEDLFYDDHGENFQPLIQEIGNVLINGFKPSKN
jgi:hypothetical protein